MVFFICEGWFWREKIYQKGNCMRQSWKFVLGFKFWFTYFLQVLRKRTIYWFQILQISWHIHWLFTAEKKPHGSLTQAIFFGISLCTGQLMKFRHILPKYQTTYNRKSCLGFNFFPNRCCYGMNLFLTALKRKIFKDMFEENNRKVILRNWNF